MHQPFNSTTWNHARLNTMPTPRTTFPVAEGIGVFVGIIAWDLFNDGHLELLKAIAIAAPCSLVWYGVRHWKARSQNKERQQ